MRRTAAAFALLGSLLASSPANATEPPALIPLPASMSAAASPGAFRLAQGARLFVPAGDRGAMAAAQALAERGARLRRLRLVVAPGSGAGVAFVRGTPTLAGPEAYDLVVTPAGVRITASGDAGLFYGAMTLAQLLSPDVDVGQPVALPALTIHDAPRFAWRGLMLDVARHFQPLGSIHVLIDQMAAHKLNVLHLHLTDDQGWRLEIKRYPRLAEVGGWRTPPDGGPRVGGFYTQAQMRALVAYAAARHVTVVPEIDLPGHAQAAVAAYPGIGVFGDRPVVATDWGVNPYLFATTPKSSAFLEGVLDEVMAVFPSTFVHVGGDEAIKDQWVLSPQVQAQMKAQGVPSEHALQSRIVEHLGRYLAAHGRRLIGWDEILQGGLPPTASIMSWRGEQGAIDAANAGHDVVLSPAPTLYFDNLQSDRGDEPPGRIGPVTLAQVYAYDALPAAIAPAQAGHVLGVQANAWSEYLITPAEVQHAVFPRLDALAEIAWSPQAARDWAGFQARLAPQLGRYAREGIAYADSAFAVEVAPQGGAAAAARAGRAVVTMRTQGDYGAIRYTLDGSTPTAASPAYAAPVAVPSGAMVRAARFAPGGEQLSAPRSLDTAPAALLERDSAALAACPSDRLGLRVPLTPDAPAPAPAFDIDIEDTCAVYRAAPLDLAQGFVVHAARLRRNYGLAHDFDHVKARFAATRFGELVVKAGGCDGEVADTFPLPDPAASGPRMTFRGALPPGRGDADLCLLFTWPPGGPLYEVERMSLVLKGAARP